MPSETKSVPFHVADIGEEEISAVSETLRSGWITTGARTHEFESAFAAYIGASHAVAVNSATAALHLALDAAGVSEGDEVIVPTMTFAASAEVVTYMRARPVLVDCDPDTLCVRASDIERAMTPRTRAVMPVHYAGHPCDMDPILELAAAKKVTVIEDAAHALPATYKGRMVGSIGDMTAFSFYATKTLTTGEGGMLATDNEAFAERARLMSLHGISRHAWNRYAAEGSWRYDILAPGFKYNLTDIASSLGLVQLRKVEAMWRRRVEIARAYQDAFAAVDELQLPAHQQAAQHAWHLYPIRVRAGRLRIGRDDFIEQLTARGIGTSVHFIPLHQHLYYRQAFGYQPGDFPNADAAFEELISLPIYPRMGSEDAARVTDAVRDIVEANRR